MRAAKIDPSGQRRVPVIGIAVHRSDPDPDFCTRASVAAALSEAKEIIAGQQELAERDTHNDFSGAAPRP